MCCRAVRRNTFRWFEAVGHSRRSKAAKHSVWVASPITAPQVTVSVLQWMMASVVNLWCRQTTPTIKWSRPNVWVRGRRPLSFCSFVPVTLSETGTMAKMDLCEEYFSRASEHWNMSVGEQWKEENTEEDRGSGNERRQPKTLSKRQKPPPPVRLSSFCYCCPPRARLLGLLHNAGPLWAVHQWQSCHIKLESFLRKLQPLRLGHTCHERHV